MAVVQAAQCGSLRQVVGELVGHLIQNGVSGAKFIQDSFIVGSLGIDGVQRTVKLKGAGGPGGIGGVGVKIPPRHELFHGAVQLIGTLHQIGLIHMERAVGGHADHS